MGDGKGYMGGECIMGYGKYGKWIDEGICIAMAFSQEGTSSIFGISKPGDFEFILHCQKRQFLMYSGLSTKKSFHPGSFKSYAL